MTYYGIFVNGSLDCDPEPMIFRTHEGAYTALHAIMGMDLDIYDPDKTDIRPMTDDMAKWILEEYNAEAGE